MLKSSNLAPARAAMPNMSMIIRFPMFLATEFSFSRPLRRRRQKMALFRSLYVGNGFPPPNILDLCIRGGMFWDSSVCFLEVTQLRQFFSENNEK